MALPEYQYLTLNRDGDVLTATLNRPQLMNATNPAMERELCNLFTDINCEPDIRVLVLTGAGNAFCAGGDFDFMTEALEDPAVFWNAMPTAKRLIFSLLDCNKPVVAKINGHAVGLGATLALFCDVSFAANHVKIADPHVTIGFVAGDGGAVIWPQLIGYNRAKEYLFTGEPIYAPEAEKMGLINHSVEAADLDQAVADFSRKLAAMPPRALQWTKASVNIGLKQLAHSIMDASIAYEALSNETAEHRESLQRINAMRNKKSE